MSTGCGAPSQAGSLPAGVDLEREVVITGVVSAASTPVSGAYVRLLDKSGEFTAEVVTGADGRFRFFAAPGEWTVSVLHRDGRASGFVRAAAPGVHDNVLALSSGAG